MSIGSDTIIFGVIALVCGVCLYARSWCIRVLREYDKMEEKCLEDEDMKDDDPPQSH